MDLLNYASFWRGEGPRREGFVLGKPVEEGVTRFVQWLKHSIEFLNGDQLEGAVSVQDIGGTKKFEEQDFRSAHCPSVGS